MEAKTVIITGCTRGLGRAMVPVFIEAGWRVAGFGRDEQQIAMLRQQVPSPHLFEVCDVSYEGDVAAFCAVVLKIFGAPDLVLNKAATVNPPAPLWEISAEDFGRTIDTNIKGPASMMRHLLPSMLQRGSGVIVNFSSGWGRSTAENQRARAGFGEAKGAAGNGAADGESAGADRQTAGGAQGHRAAAKVQCLGAGEAEIAVPVLDVVVGERDGTRGGIVDGAAADGESAAAKCRRVVDISVSTWAPVVPALNPLSNSRPLAELLVQVSELEMTTLTPALVVAEPMVTSPLPELMVQLAAAGFAVTAVGHALDFYQEFAKTRHRVVLIDLGLPDEAGEVLIAYVRRNTASRIVVLTGRDDIQTRVACYRMGAHLFLAKPVAPTELIAAVNSLLSDSHMEDPEPASPSVPAPGDVAVAPAEEWVLKLSKRTLLTPSGGDMVLSGAEFELLHVLAVNGGKASHDELQQQLLGVPPVTEDSASRLSAHETTGWKPVVHDRQDAYPPAKSAVLAVSAVREDMRLACRLDSLLPKRPRSHVGSLQNDSF